MSKGLGVLALCLLAACGPGRQVKDIGGLQIPTNCQHGVLTIQVEHNSSGFASAYLLDRAGYREPLAHDVSVSKPHTSFECVSKYIGRRTKILVHKLAGKWYQIPWTGETISERTNKLHVWIQPNIRQSYYEVR